MKSVKKMMMIAALLSIFFVANLVVAESGVEVDPENDVIAFVENLETGELEQTETSDVPGADIIEVSYDRVNGQTEITISFKVNENGIIETIDLDSIDDQNQLFDLLLNSSDPIPIAYSVYLLTDEAEYNIVYEGGNCTIDLGDNIDFTVDGNEFTATFDLMSSDESITKIGAQSFFMDFSMTSTSFAIYMDAAPDSFLFVSEIVGNETAKTGEVIELTALTTNLAGLLDFGLTDIDYTYEWDFDDGSSGTGETVTHTYQYPGTYTVEVTVSDAEGTEISDTLVITVSQGASSNNGNTNNGNENGDTEGSPIMIFIIIIGIIVIIGIIALVVVIKR